jgi:hypothetical protein
LQKGSHRVVQCRAGGSQLRSGVHSTTIPIATKDFELLRQRVAKDAVRG